MTNKDKTVRVYTTGCVCGKGERERERGRGVGVYMEYVLCMFYIQVVYIVNEILCSFFLW